MSENLATIRKQLKRQRASLAPAQQQQASRQAVKTLHRQQWFRAAKNIAIYLPVRGELDPTALRKHSNPRQRFYLPVLSLHKPNGLIFMRWDKHTRFRNNRFGIPEPLLRAGKLLAPQQLDLVITPLLAFDRQGNRLGMGGGFYDRSFAFKQHRSHATRPILCGFAYQFQQVEVLTRQPWDIPLNRVVTEITYVDFIDSRQY